MVAACADRAWVVAALGLALGVAGDDDVDALLVALCFHQFFEGIALSSRVVDARFSSSS